MKDFNDWDQSNIVKMETFTFANINDNFRLLLGEISNLSIADTQEDYNFIVDYIF